MSGPMTDPMTDPTTGPMPQPTRRQPTQTAPMQPGTTRTIALPDTAATEALAHELSLFVRPGDTICLGGDLGTGKTTLARALIRALAGDAALEVPSPTFTLVQNYDTPRMAVCHVDLYRIADAGEVAELGLADMARDALLIVEWPERAGGALPADRLDILLEETDTGTDGSAGGSADERRATLAGHGRWAATVARMAAIEDFLERAGWASAERRFLQGDASARRYEALHLAGHVDVLLMDMPRQPDGPPVRDGLPYSRIAHLAEDVRPVVAIGGALRRIGLSAPAIHACDMGHGFLLIERLDGEVYGDMARRGADMGEPMTAAVDVLIAIARAGLAPTMALPDGTDYTVPPFDRAAREIEAGLLLDWFWPFRLGSAPSGDAARAFREAWRAVWPAVETGETAWILRDYHSPNLIWLPDREAEARVGLIDYQDAVIGHPAYDLASLLQDARIDVAQETERDLLDYYLARREAEEPGFDAAAFRAAYAVIAAQRATKILGIFARLKERDGKPGYLRHLPRVSHYLERNLQHEALGPVRDWFAAHLPQNIRI